MKKAIIGLLGLFIFFVSSKLTAGENWEELEAFHKVMSSTFHPAEEGNFEPIKTRIGEMVEAASKMNINPVPAEYNKANILEASKKLEADSKALEEKIKGNAANEEIFKDLNALHDTFHSIAGSCNPKKEHKDKHK